MTSISTRAHSADAHKHGVLFVFAAGVLWSTVGIGIRMIDDAVVWQILLYRSISMSLFLYILIRMRSGESPFVQIRRIGSPVVVAGLSLVAAYSGGIYSIQNTSVANAMLLFATAPFMAAVLGWIVLRERVRFATWIAIVVAIGGIAIMVADKSGSVALKGSLAALDRRSVSLPSPWRYDGAEQVRCCRRSSFRASSRSPSPWRSALASGSPSF